MPGRRRQRQQASDHALRQHRAGDFHEARDVRAIHVADRAVGAAAVLHAEVVEPANFQVCGFTNCLLGSVAYNAEDREVRGGLGGGTQRTQTFGPAEPGGNRSTANADTHPFITYMPRPDNIQADTRNSNDIAEIRNLSNRTGTMDIQGYMSWLRQHGYVFAGEY